MNVEVCREPKKVMCIESHNTIHPLPGDREGDIVVADFGSVVNFDGTMYITIKSEGHEPRFVAMNRFKVVE